MPKVKDRENIKSNKRKASGNLRSSLIKMSSGCSKKYFADQKRLARNIQNYERLESTTKILYPVRLSTKMEGEIKSFSDRKKA